MDRRTQNEFSVGGNTATLTLTRISFDAVVFDLDGVLTRTAEVHAAAWKTLFDEFLTRHAATTGQPFEPFDPERDYRLYVDGRPRHDGVVSFLSARGITLPPGEHSDGPESNTVHGLANGKNRIFLELLRRAPMQVHACAAALVHGLRSRRFLVAVVTSSRNASEVLRSAGFAGSFHVQVDGRDLERFRLRGKPAPDMFTEALRRLEIPPARAVAFEDAAVGVSAARAAGFGLVVGVDHGRGDAALVAAGAHHVVSELSEVALVDRRRSSGDVPHLPSALARIDEFLRPGRPLALFLDYDGTLTGITAHPADAFLSNGVREALRELTRLGITVAVVSGRDLDNLRGRVGMEEVYYAGSHGFDIAGPSGLQWEHPGGVESLGALDAAEQFLRARLAAVPGALLERKRFALAVHYRQVADGDVSGIDEAVRDALTTTRGLRRRIGKKVFELLPDVDWHKGRAVEWIVERIGAEVWPIYVGDDATDEDALRVMRVRGTGIAVQARPAPTAAHYRLTSPAEVERLLWAIASSYPR